MCVTVPTPPSQSSLASSSSLTALHPSWYHQSFEAIYIKLYKLSFYNITSWRLGKLHKSVTSRAFPPLSTFHMEIILWQIIWPWYPRKIVLSWEAIRAWYHIHILAKKTNPTKLYSSLYLSSENTSLSSSFFLLIFYVLLLLNLFSLSTFCPLLSLFVSTNSILRLFLYTLPTFYLFPIQKNMYPASLFLFFLDNQNTRYALFTQ